MARPEPGREQSTVGTRGAVQRPLILRHDASDERFLIVLRSSAARSAAPFRIRAMIERL